MDDAVITDRRSSSRRTSSHTAAHRCQFHVDRREESVAVAVAVVLVGTVICDLYHGDYGYLNGAENSLVGELGDAMEFKVGSFASAVPGIARRRNQLRLRRSRTGTFGLGIGAARRHWAGGSGHGSSAQVPALNGTISASILLSSWPATMATPIPQSSRKDPRKGGVASPAWLLGLSKCRNATSVCIDGTERAHRRGGPDGTQPCPDRSQPDRHLSR